MAFPSEMPTAHGAGWLAWLKTASRQLPNDLIELMDQEGCVLGGDVGLQQSDGNRFFEQWPRQDGCTKI